MKAKRPSAAKTRMPQLCRRVLAGTSGEANPLNHPSPLETIRSEDDRSDYRKPDENSTLPCSPLWTGAHGRRPGPAASYGYPPVKIRWSGRGGMGGRRNLSSKRRCPPGMPSTSTSLTRTTGRPRKKCIEYSPHMEQQHGLLVVDKPRGLSSAQCTNRFKRLGQKKIGHAGTLDPMAQGVLLVLLGHATKISG